MQNRSSSPATPKVVPFGCFGQTNKNKSTNKLTNKQAKKQTSKQTNKQTSRAVPVEVPWAQKCAAPRQIKANEELANERTNKLASKQMN